jgi:hypothetical protein
VKITDDNEVPEQLEYVAASHRTMAISHVWSHGQGGRPHLGINACLYQWYRAIARRQWDAERGVPRCDSFWIDSACIPDEYGLRKEAISNINTIFSNAGVVMVIDRDIMDCVASRSEEDMVSLHEAWQNSEWNKRAWTLLEGVRGTGHLHLLCAKDRVVSVKDMIQRMRRLNKVRLWGQEDPELVSVFERDPADYSFPFEHAGTLLARRTASRPGDIPVIWSLLCPNACGNGIYDNMASLLRKVAQGPGIHTCFLMATMPRLRVPGFCWGPTGDPSSAFNYRASRKEPDNSALGIWRSGSLGLTARWLVWELRSPSDWPANLRLAALVGTKRGPDVTLCTFCLRSGQRVALLQAADQHGRLCHASLRSYSISRRLVAGCLCRGGRWGGVYEWKGLFIVEKKDRWVGWSEAELENLTAHFICKEMTLM